MDDLTQLLTDYKFTMKRISDFRNGMYLDGEDNTERRKKRRNIWMDFNYRLWKHLTKKLKKAEIIN